MRHWPSDYLDDKEELPWWVIIVWTVGMGTLVGALLHWAMTW